MIDPSPFRHPLSGASKTLIGAGAVLALTPGLAAAAETHALARAVDATLDVFTTGHPVLASAKGGALLLGGAGAVTGLTVGIPDAGRGVGQAVFLGVAGTLLGGAFGAAIALLRYL